MIRNLARRFADGLSSLRDQAPTGLDHSASIPRGKTIVYLRSTQIPASFWEDEVRYDAWGAPYVRGYGSRKGEYDGPATALMADGRTSATFLYGTKWKHKSGPPVQFGEAPKDPFASRPDRNPKGENGEAG